jgi:acetyl-CoA C-acetyltransferase
MNIQKKVYIVSATRTPIGNFNSCLSTLSASDLGSIVIKSIVENLPHDLIIDHVYMGNVLSANVGQAPARQAMMKAGVASKTDATTINKVCASGIKAITLGIQSILCGDADVIIAGGMESMSNAPHYFDKSRTGIKLGNGVLIDGIIKDGLWDSFNNLHMGSITENTVKNFSISRQQQDFYATQSFKRAQQANIDGHFKNEITPIELEGKNPTTIIEDENLQKINLEKMPTLKPVFDSNGTITAANASSINDGAAAVLLVSEEALFKYKLKPIAKIVAYSDSAQDPIWFTTAPVLAIDNALKKAKLTIDEIDYFEINEAFAAVCIAINNDLNIHSEKLNVWGGAIALGHPIGCSGARIVVTLQNILNHYKGKYGVAAICNGGGGATALIIERCE